MDKQVTASEQSVSEVTDAVSQNQITILSRCFQKNLDLGQNKKPFSELKEMKENTGKTRGELKNLIFGSVNK